MVSRILAFTFIASFLTACSGTGLSDMSLVRDQMNSSSEKKVFILRQNQSDPSMSLYLINTKLNGEEIATLGVMQVAIGNIKRGENVIEFSGPVTGDLKFTFNDNGKNKYFMTQIIQGMVSSDFDLIEIDASTFERRIEK